MNRTAITTLALLVMTMLVGCKHGQQKSDKARTTDPTCVATITSARYTGTGGNERKVILVNGTCFKSGDVSTSDCQTRTPNHDAPSERDWRDCKKVMTANSMVYEVEAWHSAAYSDVEIRVKGSDTHWSEPFSVSE